MGFLDTHHFKPLSLSCSLPPSFSRSLCFVRRKKEIEEIKEKKEVGRQQVALAWRKEGSDVEGILGESEIYWGYFGYKNIVM
jgi:hypothetical protein